MTAREPNKIFIASISASFFDPRVIPEADPRGTFICRLRDDVESAEEIIVAFGHRPMLFLWMTESEAREAAIRFARENLPEEKGFTNHSVVLTEIPRATFVEAQVFMSVRESFRWLLRVAGFSKT
jgi:hypothetical protein